jgi:protocatechuate 3,4-dioxygenase beta subunit
LALALLQSDPDAPRAATTSTSSTAPSPARATADPVGERKSAQHEATASDAAAASTSTGLRGSLVDAAGRPIAGAAIYAVRASTADPFELAELAARGITEPPAAITKSGEDGGFLLPMGKECVGRPWLVQALHPQFADGSKQSRPLEAGTITELGAITLGVGMEVTGTVLTEATQRPIAGATVLLRPAAMAYALTPLPGRERGLATTTDGLGAFRFLHAPPGSITLRAEADGFACAELPQVQLQRNEANEFHLVLAPGSAIAGSVTDGAGRALADAWIRAEALDLANQPAVRGRSGADGRFALQGLGVGRYRLHAAAPDHQRTVVEPVAAPSANVVLRLQPQATFAVTVLDSQGTPVTDYVLQARRAESASGGRQAAGPARLVHVTAAQLVDGRMHVRGFDPGDWQITARADGHASSDTLNLTLEDDGNEPEVQLRLRQGGTLLGKVVDARGQPIAGATIQCTTTAAGGSVAVFRALLSPQDMPIASTDASGQFGCKNVSPSTYAVRIRATGFAPAAIAQVAIADGQTRDLGTIVLGAGTEISGLALLDGQPLAGGRIQVLAVAAKDTPNGFLAETSSDAKGRWRIPAKLTEGRYLLLLNRSLPDNPFQESADQQASRTEVTVGAEPAQNVELNLRSQAPPSADAQRNK